MNEAAFILEQGSKIERIELIKEDNKWVIKDYKKVLR